MAKAGAGRLMEVHCQDTCVVGPHGARTDHCRLLSLNTETEGGE